MTAPSDGQDHRPMADGTEPNVPSGAMEVTPAIDPRRGPGTPSTPGTAGVAGQTADNPQ